MANNLKALSTAERFFYDHAGYSYDSKVETPQQGRIRCARGMAKAEAAAQRLGWEFEWEPDQEPWDSGDSDYVPEEVLNCRIPNPEDARHSLAALCSIADPSCEYRRVIEAELACEALAEMQARDPFWDVPDPEADYEPMDEYERRTRG